MENIKNELNQFFSTTKAIFRSPKVFFEKINKKKESDLRKTFKFLVILWFIGSVLTAIANTLFLLFFPTDNAVQLGQDYTVNIFISILISVFLGLILSIAGSIILHFWIKIFRGEGSLRKTFILNVYSLTPSILFGWLPLVNIFASLYMLYLLILGTQVFHKVSKKRALTMFVGIPLAILVTVVTFNFVQGG